MIETSLNLGKRTATVRRLLWDGSGTEFSLAELTELMAGEPDNARLELDSESGYYDEPATPELWVAYERPATDQELVATQRKVDEYREDEKRRLRKRIRQLEEL